MKRPRRLGTGLLLRDLRQGIAQVAQGRGEEAGQGPTGACIPPASLASRTSRDGRAARRVTPSASIALSPSTPPVILTILAYGLVASSIALAVPASSLPNAIAVGPVRSGLSASATCSLAAIRSTDSRPRDT